MLLDYLVMNPNPNARLRFHKSDMQLYIDSDAAYLVAPKLIVISLDIITKVISITHQRNNQYQLLMITYM